MPHIIGIDSGGTKIEAALVDEYGRIIARTQHEGVNLRQTNPNTAARICAEVVNDLTYRGGILPYHVAGVVLAAAGAGDAKICGMAIDAFRVRMPGIKMFIVSDAEAALEGAFAGEPGIILISGTGSIAWGKDSAGKMVRAGGFGYILGDDGSGFWIGREAIRQALSAVYRGETIPLCEKICHLWEIQNLQQAVTIIYTEQKPAPKIAKIAPIVFDLAVSGDETALHILSSAAEQLALLVENAGNRLNTSPPMKICFMGGIANRKEVITPLILKNLPDGKYEFIDAKSDAAAGAAAICKKLLYF